ncbi:MAG: AraC family transcriptional regulator [Gemmatimonadota bacterium]
MNRDERIAELARRIRAHTPTDGRFGTSIDGVDLFRASEPSPIRCVIYHPCVIIVAQGSKTGSVGGEIFKYSPARYLVLPVSLPIDAQIVHASQRTPFLSFSVRVDPSTVADILAETMPADAPAPQAVRGIAVSETTEELLDAAGRLLACLDSEADARVLAPQIRRELLYRVLQGPQGGLLRGVGTRDARLNQVSRALQLIHAEYGRALDVAELARAAHMSPSTFFDAFRAVTSHSPLQYLKEVRLTRARQIMIWEGASAKRAAAEVGYRSATQFSREFKRRFGRPPAQERAWAIETGESASARPY